MASIVIGHGTSTALGGLPHRDAAAAASFALRATVLPAIPSLPRRSPAEGAIAQALLGIDGITIGQYGAFSVDTARVDPSGDIVTDLQHDAFTGLRTFLAAAPADLEAVKWQVVGPVTLGIALARAGVPEELAFEVALHAVRVRLGHLLDAVSAALPAATQVVVVDEPELGEVADADFPVAPDVAIDLVSGALAMVEGRGITGLHCSRELDWATLVASGSDVIAVPARPSLVASAGYLQQFLDRGGVVAWGAVPTDGPVPTTAERPWRNLSDLWCELVQHGCDQVQLRRQSLITPGTDLGSFTPAVAERVLGITAEIGRRVHDQAAASRFVLGA